MSGMHEVRIIIKAQKPRVAKVPLGNKGRSSVEVFSVGWDVIV